MNEYLPSINNNPILLSFQEKQIIGYPGYTININGIVKKNGTEIKQYDNSRGYLSVCLKNGSKKSYRVHRLVASHFLNNPFDLPVVDHKNGNKYDYRSLYEAVKQKKVYKRYL